MYGLFAYNILYMECLGMVLSVISEKSIPMRCFVEILKYSIFPENLLVNSFCDGKGMSPTKTQDVYKMGPFGYNNLYNK